MQENNTTEELDELEALNRKVDQRRQAANEAGNHKAQRWELARMALSMFAAFCLTIANAALARYSLPWWLNVLMMLGAVAAIILGGWGVDDGGL